MDRPSDGLCNKFALDTSTGHNTSEPSGMKTLNSLFDFFLELFKTMCDKSYDGENADDYMQNCYSEKPFLEQAPTFYRYGVPGLGNIKEKWNMYPAWRKVNDAINIPQLREKTASESKNFVKCEESGHTFVNFHSLKVLSWN